MTWAHPAQEIEWSAVTADQMREVDRITVEELGISVDQVMEQAGRNLADLAMEILYGQPPRGHGYRVAVVCGTGNNGGGGMVAARILSNRGIAVSAVLAGRRSHLRPAPAKRWETLTHLPVDIVSIVSLDSPGPQTLFEDVDLIVDAILGYGLKGKPRGLQKKAIQAILAARNKAILSLDVPSGLDSTTGTVPGEAISARVTLTLALPKTGLMKPGSGHYVGDLYVADIGVPPGVLTRIGVESINPFTEETILRVSPDMISGLLP